MPALVSQPAILTTLVTLLTPPTLVAPLVANIVTIVAPPIVTPPIVAPPIVTAPLVAPSIIVTLVAPPIVTPIVRAPLA